MSNVILHLAVLVMGLLIELVSMSNYEDGSAPMGENMVVMFAILIGIRAAGAFVRDGARSKMFIVVGVLVGLLLVDIIGSLAGMILITLNSRGCMKFSLFVMNWIMVIFLNFLVAVILIGVISIAINVMRRKNQKEKLRKSLDSIYSKIWDKNFDAIKYVQNYKGVIDGMPFSQNEKNIIVDCFLKTVQEGSEVIDNQDGAIGLEGFKEGTKILEHPGCKHMYHQDGFLPWISNQAKCPMGRQGTRSQMIIEINKSAKQEKNLESKI